MNRIAIAVLGLLACSLSASAQTTTLTQTGPGTNCTTVGCINMPLDDLERLTWADTNSIQKFSFRGLDYFAAAKRTTNPDGSLSVDLDSALYENNGFTVHTLFDIDCFRCAEAWDNGKIVFPTEYVASGTFLYGWNGSINVTSGTGQVGFGVGQPVDSTIALLSSRPDLLQVPASVVIPQNQFYTPFTITATAPTAPAAPLGATPINVTATFPDGTVATMTVTVGTIPAPTPPDGD